MDRLLIKRNLLEHKDQFIDLYKESFDGSDVEAKNMANTLVDLSKSYGGFINKKLVSMVCTSVKKVVDINEQEYTIVNVCCVATQKEHQNKGYASEILELAFSELVNEYDSVVIQSENWDIYSKFDLIDSTTKYEYEFIKGEYPCPMIMTWSEPNIELIRSIECNTDNNFVGLLNTDNVINSLMDIYKSDGLTFKANPFAYVWYDDKNNVVDMNYNNLPQLCWLLFTIQPNNKLLLFEEKLSDDFTCFKPTGKKVVVTKTYAKSKHIFKNIKLIDFLV